VLQFKWRPIAYISDYTSINVKGKKISKKFKSTRLKNLSLIKA